MHRTWFLLALLVPAGATAAPAFAPGNDLELDRKMTNHTRYFYEIAARPFGLGIAGGYLDADALDTIRAFLAQDATDDFETATGVHPYTILRPYEGASGVGLRGGGAAPATAFRYMALKAEGAPADALAAARRDVERAIDAVLVAHAITGVPGVIARGIARLKSDEPTGPADIPVKAPNYVPMTDDQGNPLPEPKNNGVDRMDNSGGALPEGMWYWQDSCSKDQLVGWVMAMATLYDAAKGDPDIDQGKVAALQEVARRVGAGLRGKHPFQAVDGETYEYDLVIMDADGRPAQHWDLNPLSLDRTLNYPPGHPSLNVFNLVMALGIVKGLYHVSGDPEAEAFLYGELMGARGYLDHLAGGDDIDYTYGGAFTNFSNVNMTAIALFLNLWFEKDPEVLAPLRAYMETAWWDVPGLIQTARNAKQPYFEALYLAMTDRGFDADRAMRTAALLKAFELEPYLEQHRNNCDADEIAALQCVAIDGTTVLEIQHDLNGKPLMGWGDYYVATEALDPSIRPTSSFDGRSNPFKVNTKDGSDLAGPNGELNPGGDLNAAYWLLRWMPDPGAGMRSANARDHMPLPGQDVPERVEVAEPVPDTTAPDAGPEDVHEADEPGTDIPAFDADAPVDSGTQAPGVRAGGGCSTGGARAPSSAAPTVLIAILGLGLIAGFRRRTGSRSWRPGLR